jgi:hypothetical protein
LPPPPAHGQRRHRVIRRCRRCLCVTGCVIGSQRVSIKLVSSINDALWLLSVSKL